MFSNQALASKSRGKLIVLLKKLLKNTFSKRWNGSDRLGYNYLMAINRLLMHHGWIPLNHTVLHHSGILLGSQHEIVVIHDILQTLLIKDVILLRKLFKFRHSWNVGYRGYVRLRSYAFDFP